MKAVGHFLLVEKKQGQKRTVGGLEIDSSSNDRYLEAEVISVSQSVTDSTGILEGQTVLYDKMSGHDVNVRGRQLRVIRVGDVAVVL